MKSKIKRIIEIILLLLATVIFSLTLYMKFKFGDPKFEQLIYSLKFAGGTSGDVIKSGLKYCLPITIILFFILFIPTINFKRETLLNLRIKNKKFTFCLFPIKKYLGYSLFILVTCLIGLIHNIEVVSFFKNTAPKTNFYEDYYVDPKDITLQFPKKKQNLIYINLESIESDYNNFSIGNKKVNLIPNLEKIAEQNIHFSSNSSLGGMQNMYGTSWTVAGIVAQTSGIPLKVELDNYYDHYSSFLPGVTTIGDILEKEGYNQYYFINSWVSFAGRGIFFKEHGNYTINDYTWAVKKGLISKDYNVNWGYEDSKMFEFAKDRLLEISKKEKPFNFTMLTADTHAPYGYIDAKCKEPYNFRYANSIACSDILISDFIEWIKKQDFYKNTTIILAGDHLSMQGEVPNRVDKDNRSVYNAIINSRTDGSNYKNRTFTSFDLFPTTLASLGVKIQGNKLGLGTNLYSDKKTLAEELGLDYMEKELKKKSDYYDYNFLKDTYFEIQKEST